MLVFLSLATWKYTSHVLPQGEIDAHEDSFKSADESGQALLAAGHYASDEVREKVSWKVKVEKNVVQL